MFIDGIVFFIRLLIGSVISVLVGIVIWALGILFVPPALSTTEPYLSIRIASIGLGSGLASGTIWALWTSAGLSRYIVLTVALIGGTFAGIISHSYATVQYADLRLFEQGPYAGRVIIQAAFFGANLPPAIVSAIFWFFRNREIQKET